MSEDAKIDKETQVHRLRELVLWVEKEDHRPVEMREWYQAAWHVRDGQPVYLDRDRRYAGHCGTAYCVAGKAVAEYASQDVLHDCIADTNRWESEAAELLGLSDYERQRLFAGSNSARDIRRIAEKIAGGAL